MVQFNDDCRKHIAKINLSKNSLTRQKITSNHNSDDNIADNEQIEQNVHNSTKEDANSQQVSLRDALEVVPLFDRSNIPISNFIEGCNETKTMLPTPAARKNSAR